VIKRTIYEIDTFDRLRRIVTLKELQTFVKELSAATVDAFPEEVILKFENGGFSAEVIERR
jgi:hypothetical protein